MTIGYRVDNTGSTALGLAVEYSVSPADISISRKYVGGVSAGGFSNISDTITIPSTVSSGVYTITCTLMDNVGQGVYDSKSVQVEILEEQTSSATISNLVVT